MSEPFVGEIRMGAFNFAPQGWAFCDGSLLSITENETLFNLIGTTYGGDGQNTFALPNLSGRIPAHQGTGLPLADSFGSETAAIAVNQMPIHNHGFYNFNGNATSRAPANSLPAIVPSTFGNVYGAYDNTSTMNSSITTTGGGMAHENMMSFLALTFIIALYGIYPSQN